MKTVNIRDAKAHLSKLVDEAMKGEAFIIAKAGKPRVKVVRLDAPDAPTVRLGFMAGRVPIPADFDELGRDEIESLFGGAA